MKRGIIILLFLIVATRLFSLDIYINENYWKSYNNEELATLLDSEELPLWYICPLFYTVDYVLIETDLITTRWENSRDATFFKKIHIKESTEGHKLQYNGNTHNNPQSIYIKGEKNSCKTLEVWSRGFDQRLLDELDLFSQLHDIEIAYKVRENISDKIYRSDIEKASPDCIFIDEEDAVYTQNFLQNIPEEILSNPDLALPVPTPVLLPIWASSYYVESNLNIEQEEIPLESVSLNWDDRKPEAALMILTPLLNKSNFYSPETKEVMDFMKQKRMEEESAGFTMRSTLLLKEYSSKPLSVSNFVWHKKPLRARIKPVFGAIPRYSPCPDAAAALLQHLTEDFFQTSLDPSSGFFPVNRNAVGALPDIWRIYWMKTLESGYMIPLSIESLEFLDLYESLARLYLSEAISFKDFIELIGREQ